MHRFSQFTGPEGEDADDLALANQLAAQITHNEFREFMRLNRSKPTNPRTHDANGDAL